MAEMCLQAGLGVVYEDVLLRIKKRKLNILLKLVRNQKTLFNKFKQICKCAILIPIKIL